MRKDKKAEHAHVPAPQDHDAALLAGGGAPAALIRDKARIARLFDERVRAAVPAARHISAPMTIDTLPAFLTIIARALASRGGGEVSLPAYSDVAAQHGYERARIDSYTLEAVVKEYQILREILIEVLGEATDLSPGQWLAVHRSIDEAIQDAVSAFAQAQQGIRETLAATLTHDFRGPLAAASNYLQLSSASAPGEQRERHVRRAIENLKRLDRMIVDLLDVSRASAGERISLETSDFDLGALARDVIEDFGARDGERIVLHAEGPVPVFGGCERLRQALRNLLENALKYGRPGTPVTVRVLQEYGRAQVSVHNFGEPIPADERTTLFQAYRRTSSADQSGKAGWGLGLVLVRAIAEAHGGGVGVQSSADEGTTFTLDILQDVRDLEPR